MAPIQSAAQHSEEEQRNLQAVLEFYRLVIQESQFDRASEFIGPDYIQHKPGVADGPQGVLDFMANEQVRVPDHTVEVVRAFVDGDWVFLHVHVRLMPHEPDRAVMDIFRCKDGRLLEHWDVDQPVPPAAEFAHSNGMF